MHMKKHVLLHTHAHLNTHQRVRGEVRRSLSLRAGAMSCQMGLAPRQLMSQSSLWSPSRGPWFTCLGCQVLPSPSLMQHGCPLNLFVSVPLVGLPWLWPSAERPSSGGTHTLACRPNACVHTHTRAQFILARKRGMQLQMQVHQTHACMQYTPQTCLHSRRCAHHFSALLWNVLLCAVCFDCRK